MPALLDATGHAHVVNLTHARGVIAVVHEMLAPRGAITDLRPRALVTQHPRGMRIISAHERRPRRPAVGALTIRPRKARALRRNGVNIWCFANFISIARQRRRGEVIGDDEQHVILFRRIRSPQNRKG